MHTASVSTAVVENALSFQSRRSPRRRSFNIRAVDGSRGSTVRGFDGSRFEGSTVRGSRFEVLISSQCYGWIDPRGTPGRDEVGQRGHAEDDEDGSEPRHGI